MQIMKDILGFVGTLTQVDFLLYCAVLVLIILIVSLLYIIKTSDEEEEIPTPKNSEMEDLKSIVSNINNKESNRVALTDYEAEQEEKAIISYEELLEKNKFGTIHYDEEPVNDEEISIKKISLDSFMEKPKENKHIAFYNYEKEEEFLKSLKALNKLLN